MDISKLQERITTWAKAKGFHVDLTNEDIEPTQAELDLTRIMFEHRIWDRVLEQVRDGVPFGSAASRVSRCDPQSVPRLAVRILAKLALISSENTEAADCVVEGELTTTRRAKDGKPEGLGSELADIVIRVIQLAGCLEIDLESEIMAKLDFNDSRPYKHGKLL